VHSTVALAGFVVQFKWTECHIWTKGVWPFRSQLLVAGCLDGRKKSEMKSKNEKNELAVETATRDTAIGRETEIRISAPWRNESFPFHQLISRGTRGETAHFVEERSRVHEAYIREDAKTQRLRLLVAAACFIAGCVVIVFAPAQRAEVSNWLGAALIIVAAGAAGFKRLWGRTKDASLGVDDGGVQQTQLRQPPH
jgi:hypothetical protein